MRLDEIEKGVRTLTRQTSEDQQAASAFVKYGMVLLGAGLAGGAQFLDTPSTGVAWNRVIGIIGILLAFFGGVWSNRADRHSAAALHHADEAVKETKAAQLSADAFRSETRGQFEQIRRQDAQLRQLQSLTNILREGVESVIVGTDADVHAELRSLLLGAYRSLLASMRCEAGERWTVTIYQEEDGILRSAAACTVDRGEENAKVREWPIGQGFAGAAYVRAQEVVLADAQAPNVRALLNVPSDRSKPGDDAKYRSVAAVPVRVANQSKPWGVVIATSDQVGRFDASDNGEAAMSAQAIRILAGMVALIVAAEIRAPRL